MYLGVLGCSKVLQRNCIGWSLRKVSRLNWDVQILDILAQLVSRKGWLQGKVGYKERLVTRKGWLLISASDNFACTCPGLLILSHQTYHSHFFLKLVRITHCSCKHVLKFIQATFAAWGGSEFGDI